MNVVDQDLQFVVLIPVMNQSMGIEEIIMHIAPEDMGTTLIVIVTITDGMADGMIDVTFTRVTDITTLKGDMMIPIIIIADM